MSTKGLAVLPAFPGPAGLGWAEERAPLGPALSRLSPGAFRIWAGTEGAEGTIVGALGMTPHRSELFPPQEAATGLEEGSFCSVGVQAADCVCPAREGRRRGGPWTPL